MSHKPLSALGWKCTLWILSALTRTLNKLYTGMSNTYVYLKRWRASHPETARAHDRAYKLLRRPGPWREAWLRVLAHYGSRCMACGVVDDVHPDHVRPVSDGGTNHPANLQPLCRACNSRKRDCTDYRPDHGQAFAHEPHWQSRGRGKAPIINRRLRKV